LSRCQLRRLRRSWQLTARFELKSVKFDLKAQVLDFDVSGFLTMLESTNELESALLALALSLARTPRLF
jgi:hypothetical protein